LSGLSYIGQYVSYIGLELVKLKLWAGCLVRKTLGEGKSLSKLLIKLNGNFKFDHGIYKILSNFIEFIFFLSKFIFFSPDL